MLKTACIAICHCPVPISILCDVYKPLDGLGLGFKDGILMNIFGDYYKEEQKNYTVTSF